ncbi:MAG TPA: GNAT family N-acetyltransferase [Thermoanaerobaculia bacterium]|jgi:GNAT superfamily N-acetyltransferase|nr:GNAT family N-acetyltransferase [Thermoanaerobaculia bacterium]
MTAYRFCRTDDRALLVAAFESCRGPEDEGEPPLDNEGFKRLVRDLDLWCSSCMVAFEGKDAVGVLLGAKRATTTLVYGLRVHPEHRRRGHARHLLTSLSSKLAILGPPGLLAEVPAERRGVAGAAFEACGWKLTGSFRDWRRAGGGATGHSSGGAREALGPVSFEELQAGGLVGNGLRCWQRDLPSLTKPGRALEGLAFHSQERIEAWALYEPGATAGEPWQIFLTGLAPGPLGRLGFSTVMDELSRLAGDSPLVLARAAPDEIGPELLDGAGFELGDETFLYTSEAQAA